jgi:DNA-binding CsgD family transcriptional regulator
VIGREDGDFLIVRCPRDSDVSTPESLWQEDPHAESLAYTLGTRVTPAAIRRRTRACSIAPVERTIRAATLNDRERAILRESEAERSYAEIGREHDLSRERVRQIVKRAQKIAVYLRATGA